MYFKVFSVDTTNIFPAANSRAGGQLFTEFNTRSRDFVISDDSIEYLYAPSYVHSEADFYVKKTGESVSFFPETTTTVSNSLLEILPGIAMVNGYFIQSLVPVTVDLAAAAIDYYNLTGKKFTGHMGVGLRAMFSTAATMAGSILVENSNSVFEGIQIVVLPMTSSDPADPVFRLPEDVPHDGEESEVTAHLKLAEFDFINGVVSGITNNYPAKCQAFPALRVKNIDSLIASSYVSKNGLQPKKLYTFAGKGQDPETGKDTWCDSTDSLMVWDTDPQLMTETELEEYTASLGGFNPVKTTTSGALEEAVFGTRATGEVALMVPHKQVDYNITNQSSDPQVYAPKMYPLPAANFYNKTAGTVTPEYTKAVLDISRRLSEFYQLGGGKQRAYIAVLDDRTKLPQISSDWNVGDYVLVGADNTVAIASDAYTAPATLYVVAPGTVTSIEYTDKHIGGYSMSYKPTGEGCTLAVESDTCLTEAQCRIGYDEGFNDPDKYNAVFAPNGSFLQQGVPNVDYYIYEGHVGDASQGQVEFGYWIKYTVKTASTTQYADPIFITGTIPLATEDSLGGFLDVDETTARDAGYVYLDETGHLRLVDYALLRSGTLAYQLGEDFSLPSTLAATEIQDYLDEYVNNRVAFPNANQLANSKTPYTINITVPLPDAEESTTINIEHIDSRFGTCIYLHFTGTGKNIIVNIADCQQVRIDSNFPTVSTTNPGATYCLYRSKLFYDATVLDKLSVISDLTLWYARYDTEMPDLVVEGLTVRQLTNLYSYSGTIDIWDETHLVNDNHFQFALSSITFDGSGNIVGCTVLAANSMTTNLDSGKYIFSTEFTLPQTAELMFPQSKLTKPLKVTGEFIAAYNVTGTNKFITNDTKFTLITQSYPADADATKGSIAILVDANEVNCVTTITEVDGVKYIDGWEPGSYHVFSGGIIE